MSMFRDAMGMDPAAVRTTLGVNDGGGFDADKKGDFFPLYVPLDHRMMELIEDLYVTESLIQSANNLMSHHNLGKSFTVKFAGTELDDDKYHHLAPIEQLLEQARRAKHMYGFVPVHDLNAHLDNQVREILEEPLLDDDDTAEAATVVGEAAQRRSELFGREGNSADADVDESRKRAELASMHIHRAATGLGQPDPRGDLLGAGSGVGDRTGRRLDGSAARVETQTVPTARGGADTVIVRREHRTSTLEAPNASATIVSSRDVRSGNRRGAGGAGAGSDGSGDGQRRVRRVAVSRTFDEVFSSVRDIRVVNWRDGRLFLRIDQMTGERSVVFCRRSRDYDETDSEYLKAISERKLPQALTEDPSVKVFVWPNRMPDDRGRINSNMVELLMLRNQWTNADKRLQTADKSNAEPTVFLSYDEKLTPETIADMTEQQLFGAPSGADAASWRADKRAIIQNYRMQIAADVLNGKRKRELDTEIARGVEKPSVEGSDRKKETVRVPHMFVQPLPRGFSVSQVVMGKTLDDVERRRLEYQTRVASTMGIPLALLQGGGSGGSGKGSGGGTSTNVTSGAAALVGDLFRSTILRDREDLALFFNEIWDVLYRAYDTRAFARLLGQTRAQRRADSELAQRKHRTLLEQYRSITDAAEEVRAARAVADSESYMTALIAHYSRLEQLIREVNALEYRVEIEFTKHLFVTFEELEQAKASAAISGYEYANVLRTKMAMPPLTEAEYEANKRAALDDARKEMLALQPPVQPGAGGGGASSSSKAGGSRSNGSSTAKRSTGAAQSSSATTTTANGNSGSASKRTPTQGSSSSNSTVGNATKRARTAAANKSVT